MFVFVLNVLLPPTRQPEGFHFDSHYTFTLKVSLGCSNLGSPMFVSPRTLLVLGGLWVYSTWPLELGSKTSLHFEG